MPEKVKNNRTIWLAPMIGVLVVVLALVIGRLLWWQAHQISLEELQRTAERLSLTINVDELIKLGGIRKDEGTPEYQRLKQHLILSKQLFPESRFLYIMGVRTDKTVFFYADSEPSGSEQESLPGDRYPEYTDIINSVYENSTTKVSSPITDEWGTWVNVLVPIIDHKNGHVMALFGLDIDADQWNQQILTSLLFPYTILFLFIIFSCGVILYFRLRILNPDFIQPTFLHRHAEFLVLLILGLLATSIVTWNTVERSKRSRQTTFENLATSYAGYVSSYLQNLERFHLAGLVNFFNASEYVDLEEFNLYTDSLAIDSDTLAWEWIPAVRADELQEFEELASAELGMDYQVWELSRDGRQVPVKDRTEYYPIFYLAPQENNENALGFDVGSEKTRLEMLQNASDSGLVTASDPINLVNNLENQTGFLITMPIGHNEDQLLQRGFVMIVLKVENLLESAVTSLENLKSLIYIDFLQLHVDDSPSFLAGNSPEEYSLAHVQSNLHDHPFAQLTFQEPIYAFGKTYSLIIHPGEMFLQMYRIRSGWIAGIVGVLFSFLTAGISHLFFTRNRKLTSMVAERTIELRESELKYRNLAESTSAVLWEYDIQNDKWTYVAPQITQMTGWQPDDFTNMQFWVEHLYQDDQNWAPAFCADFTKKGEDHEFEYRFLKSDGSFLWIRDVVSVEVKDGSPIFLRGYMLDVTQRKEVEEQLQMQSMALFNSANAIIITNTKGVIEWSNPAFSQLTGYSQAEIIGKNPKELIYSGVQKREFYEKMWDTILSGEHWHGEIVNRKKDGNLYSEEMSITPVRDENNVIKNFIAIKQDISERKKHELEMEAIATISSVLRKSNSKTEMLPEILNILMDLFRAEGSALILRDNRSGDSVYVNGAGVFKDTLKMRLPAGKSISGIVAETGQPFVTADISKEEGIVWSEAYQKTKAIACVPIIVDGNPIGNIRIGRTFEITPVEVRLLTSIADIIGNALQKENLREEMIDQLNQLSTLRSIDQVLTSIVDLRIILNFILEQIMERLKVDAVAIHLYNPATHKLEFTEGRGFRTQEIERTNLNIGEHNLGRVARDRKTLILPKIGPDDFPCSPLVSKEKFISYFATSIYAKGQIKGVIEVFNRTYFDPNEKWINYFEILAGQTAIAIDNSQLFEGLQRSNLELSLAYDATIEGWSRAMDLRDKETEGHTERVTDLTILLAHKAGFSGDDIIQIRRGALLHDMGKLGIPDNILHKPGQLTDEEWVLMKKHPVFAYEMLSPINYLRKAMDIPYCHHEKWDGSGYPRGLKGEEIPLAARIFAIVDVYDALTSDRPYRQAWSKEKTLDYIAGLRAIQFDPAVVDLFFEVIQSEE